MQYQVDAWAETNFRDSWKSADKTTPCARLRKFYKDHPGVVRFINFPIKHQVWVESVRYPSNYNRHGYYTLKEDRMRVMSSSLVFDAKVWDISVESRPHPARTVHQYGATWGPPKLDYLVQQFVAPFRKENERLILCEEVPLRLFNCGQSTVLLDMLQEQGAVVGKDFEFTKRENYIVPKSDTFRLMLAEKLNSWHEFDMMFTIAHPNRLEYTVVIDDLK